MRRARLALAVAVLLAAAPVARAWHPAGHDMITRAALESLPEAVPGFLRLGADRVAHVSLDPDLHRRDATPALKAQAGPEHYCDLELLGDAALPESRPAFRALLREKGIAVERIGALPYALVEATERLAIALAEHRKWPGNPHLRAKCWHHAGILAHYAADACMPLHLTIHYDGRVPALEADSPRTGIHERVDALPAKIAPGRVFTEPLPEAEPFDDLWQGVRTALRKSHGRVDRVYALEPDIPAADAALADESVREWTVAQCRRAAQLTARLIVTALSRADEIPIPPAFDRSDYDAR